MTLSNREIQNALLYDGNHELFQSIERNLRERLTGMHDGITRADLMSLLVIALLKKNLVETDQTKKELDAYMILVREVERSLRGDRADGSSAIKSSALLYRIFVSMATQRCTYIEALLAKTRANASVDSVRVMRYSLEVLLARHEKNHSQHFLLLFYKFSTLFGTSFVMLIFFILFVVLVFAGAYCAYDVFSPNGPVISTIGRVDSFDYYFYVSMATFSNLWVDTSLAANLLLRAIFSFEQVFGLILFWLAISLIGRRFA